MPTTGIQLRRTLRNGVNRIPLNLKFLNIGRCPVQPDQLDKQGWNEQDTEEEDQWRRKKRWQVNHILLNECLNFFIINDIVGKKQSSCSRA